MFPSVCSQTVKNSSANPNRRLHHQSSRTELQITTFAMSHKENNGADEINNNKAVQRKKPKTSLINKLFKRKKPSKATVTSSSSTDSESEDQNTHYRFFSKRKSKRKSTGVKNVTQKFDHVVISPEHKAQSLSANTSPYQIRHMNSRIEYEHENNVSSDNTNQTEHLYINTLDIQPWLSPKGSIPSATRHDILRGIANEQEYLRRLHNSSHRRQESPHKKANDQNYSVKRSNSGRGVRKDLQPNQSPSQVRRGDSTKRSSASQTPHHANEVLQTINNRMHYRSDDNISRTYENSAMFDHLNGNLSSPSTRRSRKHLSDDDNISLRRRNSKTETNSSNENVNSNSLSRRSRAARNERYYKRLSRDHEVEKLALPLSPKNRHRVVQQTNSLPTSAQNTNMKINYAPRYPHFQKISQPLYNMNSTYPLPQSVGNSRVSSTNSINKTVHGPHSSRSAVVNRSRLSSSGNSSYPQNSTYPPQQNLSRMSSSSTLSQANTSNYPTFPPTDMKLVHAIPFKSVSYDSNINGNTPQQVVPRDVKSMSYDNINQNQSTGRRKIPPSPPPRNPNRKTIAIYEPLPSMVNGNMNRHSSHQPYEYGAEHSNTSYQSEGNVSRIPYNEAYTGERAYLIKQAHPSSMANPSESFINNVQSAGKEDSIQTSLVPNQINQSYFHHKDNAQVRNDSFYPDSRYTNNDRLNEPNQYMPNLENNNVQFYSATSKIISSSPKISPAQNGYSNTGEQLYENTPSIRSQYSHQKSKRPSSISPPDPQNYKRSFTDQNFPDPQILMKNQRLTRSNETLPYDENLSRINEIGIPIHLGTGNTYHKVRVPSVKRPLKSRQSLEVKESIRPLSIVLEKSENELESDRISNPNSNRNLIPNRKVEDNSRRDIKLNENGLRITRDGKNMMGSSSNLDDALTELEQIYESLNLNDEDLLDRAERRDLPTCYQMSKDQIRDTPEVEEINRILGNSNNPNRTQASRRIAIANKDKDDMAIRKYRYQKENQINPNNSETGSYLLISPTLSPPPFFEDKPASPITLLDAEPDVTRDDVVYRNTKYVNNLLKPHDPQPFGIPLRPVINASNTDYLHATPDTEKYRSTFHNSKTPDVVMDDLAYRNLRKDYNKDCNALPNFNLIPAFRSERNSSPLSDKDRYLSNLDYEERFQKRKKRAMRSLSGNLFMRDYHGNESEQITEDFLRENAQSNIVRSQTTSPDYQTNKSLILDSDFEKLKDRWLSTPSPEDMERMKNRERSLISYINKNSTTNNKVDNGEININTGVENLRKKFVISKTSDRSNPFKKMLNDDFDITPEIESIRKKFVSNKTKPDNKNGEKAGKQLEKSLEGTVYKTNFENIKNQFNSKKNTNIRDTDNNEKSTSPTEIKSDHKKCSKNNIKDNPFVSKFENIRSIFSEKNGEEEVKEIIKPKKKIKKFRETNNNSIVTSNDYYDYKSNMDKSIDCLKKRGQAEDLEKTQLDNNPEDASTSDSSQIDSQKSYLDEIGKDHTVESSVEQTPTDESNRMTKDDELLQQLAKETTETSELINQKLRQLSTKVEQHKPIKLNQFPINLDENDENAEDRKIARQSILKNVQTVSIESEYDNIPRLCESNDQLEYGNQHDEVPSFDDLDIPHDTNLNDNLDLSNLVNVGNIVQKFEKGNSNSKAVMSEESRIERNRIDEAPIKKYVNQMSVTSEYDNVSLNNRNQDSSKDTVNAQGINRKQEVLLKQIDTSQCIADDNEPFVSLTMKNVPSEDLESSATSDNEVVISELSDEGLNSQEMDLINNYFQNGKTVNTVGIKITDIKNLNFESDSSFNSEVQNIFSPQSKSNVDEDCTDSEIENLPIDLQIEILENKSISSLDNESYTEDFHRNNENKDKYSLELEKTLDADSICTVRSESLKTLCQSPDDDQSSTKITEDVVKTSDFIEPENSITNDNLRQNEVTERDHNIENLTTNENVTRLVASDNENCRETLSYEPSKYEEQTSEDKLEIVVSNQNQSSNDKILKTVSTLNPEDLCDKRISRSKSNDNVLQPNGKTKSPQHSEPYVTEYPAIQGKPSNGFGKCCSSSSSSNLDLCSSEASSKSSNQCRDVTPVRRRRSLPESPVKTLSLSSICAHLTRPEGTSYNLIAMIFVMLALYIAYARGLHIVTLLAFISLACIFFS